LFVSWEAGARLRLFSELELVDAFRASEEHDPITRNARFELERFYADISLSDTLDLRLGKFLTPIGRWNLTHAEPLVWTTTRPLATEHLFSKHGAGLMLHGTLGVRGRDLDYALYADASEALDPHRSENPFDNAAGLHLLYHPWENGEVGFSYVNYALNDAANHRHNLVGAEFFWSRRRFELSGELVYRDGAGLADDAVELFVQGVVPVADKFYAIGRYEFFDQETAPPSGHLGVLGLAYRPLPPVVFKVEYRLGTENETLAPDGFFTSIAILF
jgi:hypothetical protein